MSKRQVPSLRWAVRHCTPAGSEYDHWGDVFFADAFCAALRRRGQVADSYRHGVPVSPDNIDVNLIIRGRYRESVIEGKINILWIISYPERVTIDEINEYDLIFAASSTLSQKLTQLSNREVYPLLQATNPNYFNTQRTPIPYTRPLFIGSTCIEDDGSHRRRPVIEAAIATDMRIDVIGRNWADEFPREWLVGEFIEYADTACHYRGAPITFADHYESMAQESIFQARLFDAVACGTRMVSDYVEGVEELFQGAVKTWRTAEEFAYLCSPKGYKEFPSDDEMLRIAQYVQTEHSFDQRADVIVDAALNTRRNNTRQ